MFHCHPTNVPRRSRERPSTVLEKRGGQSSTKGMSGHDDGGNHNSRKEPASIESPPHSSTLEAQGGHRRTAGAGRIVATDVRTIATTMYGHRQPRGAPGTAAQRPVVSRLSAIRPRQATRARRSTCDLKAMRIGDLSAKHTEQPSLNGDGKRRLPRSSRALAGAASAAPTTE